MPDYAVEIKTREELEKILREHELVFLEVRNKDSYESRYLSRILASILGPLGSRIKMVFIDHKQAPELLEDYPRGRYVPIIRLYIRGQMVWEQEGVLANESADRLAIRRGLREVLKQHGFHRMGI